MDEDFDDQFVPQTQPIDARQERNAAGGYSFTTDEVSQLRRFLTIGTFGGTFYFSQTDLQKENMDRFAQFAERDPLKVVAVIEDVLLRALALRRDTALYTLAFMASYQSDDKERRTVVRNAAFEAALRVIRIPTDLFNFVDHVRGFRGMGTTFTRFLRRWYGGANEARLAMHAWKYRQRDGWTHGKLLKLAHPKPKTEERNAIFHYMRRGVLPDEIDTSSRPLQQIAAARELAHLKGLAPETIEHAVKLIRDFSLTREAVPTHLLRETSIWSQLLREMPLEAMVRNLGRLTAMGLFDNGGEDVTVVVNALTSEEIVQRSRIHPLRLWLAMTVYAQGRGDRTQWTPNSAIMTALDTAFQLSFRNVTPTNKKIVVAIDESGSMRNGSVGSNSGITSMSALRVASVIAYIISKTEPNATFVAFDTKARDFEFAPTVTLENVHRHFGSGGGTDTSLPMMKLMQENRIVDAIVMLTDSETWAGHTHAVHRMQEYRRGFNPDAKIINVGMTATRATTIDPCDTKSMEVAGFSADVMALITNFLNE